MTNDIFMEWRAAVERDELKHRQVVFNRFEPWIISAGLDAAQLAPEDYDEFIKYLTLSSADGMARGVATYDSHMRSFYRWALRNRLVSKLPFRDKEHLFARPKPPKLTTDEVVGLCKYAVARAQITETRLDWRVASARTALAIGLVYQVGYSAGELYGLKVDDLNELFVKVPEIESVVLSAAQLYFELVGPDRVGSHVFVPPNASGRHRARYFTIEIKRMAIRSNATDPSRFSVEEIRKRHKADFPRESARTRLLLQNRTGRSIRLSEQWSHEEVVTLLDLHPRAEQPPVYGKPNP